MNRKLRSKLPTFIDEVTVKLNINAYEQMIKNKQKQKNYFDKNSSKTEIQFNVGDKMYIQYYKNKFWEKGVVMEKLNSSRSYSVQLENGTILRRNVINIRKRKELEFNEEQSKIQTKPTIFKKETNKNSKIPTPTTVITKSGRSVKKPIRLNYV